MGLLGEVEFLTAETWKSYRQTHPFVFSIHGTVAIR